MRPSTSIALGGVLAALAVALGALGAHALKSRLSPEQLATFHTAVHYQMLDAIGMILAGSLGLRQRSGWFAGAAWAMLTGIVLFSGLLVAWIATGQRLLVHIVPVGGVSMIAGWLLLAVGAAGLGERDRT